ncbi:MAG: hypothetical protein WEC81_01830, partial [Patescibacteria group bacterium]
SSSSAAAVAKTSCVTVAQTSKTNRLPAAGAEVALLPGAMTAFAAAFRRYVLARKEAALFA